MKFYKLISVFLSSVLLLSGCAEYNNIHKSKKKCNVCEYDICDIISQPEHINIIEMPEYSKSTKDVTKREMLSGFPFISYKPIIDFGGKFPPEFYSSIRFRWKAVSFNNANYWNLRWNPHLYDIIYVKPLWIGDFSFKSEDFLKDLSYTYNVSFRELNILKNWIKNGGVLWIESAIYISSYDVALNRLNRSRLSRLFRKIRRIKILGQKVNTFALRARMIDKFHTKPLNKTVVISKSLSKQPNLLRGIHRLKLTQYDYLGAYFTVRGKQIIKYNGKVYASYINYGKGKIITTIPFDFLDVHYDGELYRWNLLMWLLKDRNRSVVR